MIPSVLELLLQEEDELGAELYELEATITSTTYPDGNSLRLTRRERKAVLRVLEARRIRVLADLALCGTAFDLL